MERHRAIAAAPVRTATEAWKVVSKLLADTLERSPSIPVGSVDEGIAPLMRLAPALIAGGHLEADGLVLVDEGLHVTITVRTADAALAVEENLSPIPGGAGATEDWKLYVPASGALDAAIASACKGSAHLSAEKPPASAPAKKNESTTGASAIDVDALRKLRGPS
jgi:hypothetical protein